MKLAATLTKWPLLAQIRDYRADWAKADLAAGISVAAVSIPSAIAYPAIAGLPMEVGLFSTIFALVGYALLGPSRKLMVGPIRPHASCWRASLPRSGRSRKRTGLASPLS